MTRDEVAACYTLAMTNSRQAIRREELEAWYTVLGPTTIDGAVALEATRRLCLRDSAFPPSSGEVYAETQRLDGSSPPSVEAATGHYLAGRWTAHPAVKRAASKVYWDRSYAPDAATREFRRLYAAELDNETAARGVVEDDASALSNETPLELEP